MWRYCLQDAAENRTNTKGRVIMFLLRLAAFCRRRRVTTLLAAPYLLLYKIFVEWLLGIEIPCTTAIGPGLRLYHGQALVVHQNAILGHSCTLRHSTTIGNAHPDGGCPIIGNHVDVGANVCIIGPIRIGDNVRIGSGAVVVKDVPANSVVVGNPARVVRSLPIVPSSHTPTLAVYETTHQRVNH